MLYRVTHRTIYDYTQPALNCQNTVHLTPRDLPHQRCGQRSLVIRPTPQWLSRYTDYFGNAATRFSIDDPHDKLTITATCRVEVTDRPALDLAASLPWEQTAAQLLADRSPAVLDACQFVFRSPYVSREPEFADYARPSFAPGRPVLDAAMDLTRRIHADFEYKPQITDLTTRVEQVLESRRGVCQDFAHLQIAALRSLGLSARYVSGYLRTDPPAGKPRLVGADASHAWIEVFCPKLGWQSFDPTNACLGSPGSDRHIVLAWGRDYGDVSPIKGVVLGGGEHKLKVTVDAEPVAA